MTIHANVNVTQEQIAAFCRKWQIVELDLFGSVLRDDFTPDSDIDVMVTFAPGVNATLHGLVSMHEELEALFGRKVDLVQRPLVEQSENPFRRREILSNARPVYVA